MPPKKSTKRSGRSWKAHDDAQLFGLFKKGKFKGGVDVSDLTPEYIEKVRDTHFPWYEKMENFNPLYKRKLRKFQTNETLSGARKEKKEGEHIKRTDGMYYLFLLL